MTTAFPSWIGADPGGKKAFGIAVLRRGSESVVATVDCADDALTFVQRNVDGKPSGVGVDAPLWWSSGSSSDRLADQWLRKRYGLPGGEVQAANSLRGAALVQAAMFIHRLRELFPAVGVTEVHPKALLKVVTGGSWADFTARYGVLPAPYGQHARDAVIGAVAAREGFEGRWTHDLASTRMPSEQDPQRYWLGPIHYFWPER